jgi:hypothetical protein
MDSHKLGGAAAPGSAVPRNDNARRQPGVDGIGKGVSGNYDCEDANLAAFARLRAHCSRRVGDLLRRIGGPS